MTDSYVTPWIIAHQAPLPMGFPRQEYVSGLPFPSPGDLPDPGIEPVSPAWQADYLPHFFLDFTYKGCHTIFLLLCLTYFTQHDNL